MLSESNNFTYPPKPTHWPMFDPLSERPLSLLLSFTDINLDIKPLNADTVLARLKTLDITRCFGFSPTGVSFYLKVVQVECFFIDYSCNAATPYRNIKIIIHFLSGF